MHTSGDSWTISYKFDQNVDFCIWLLLQDGLRVPPFDQHPDGHALLRGAGLDAETWLDWTRRVVAARTRRHSQTRSMDDRREALRFFAREDRPPGEEWLGRSSIRVTLDDMWDIYVADGPDAPMAADWVRELTMAHWKQFDPVKQKIEGLYVYFVSYPHPVSFVVPPANIIIGTMEGLLTVDALMAMVRDGAFALADLA